MPPISKGFYHLFGTCNIDLFDCNYFLTVIGLANCSKCTRSQNSLTSVNFKKIGVTLISKTLKSILLAPLSNKRRSGTILSTGTSKLPLKNQMGKEWHCTTCTRDEFYQMLQLPHNLEMEIDRHQDVPEFLQILNFLDQTKTDKNQQIPNEETSMQCGQRANFSTLT